VLHGGLSFPYPENEVSAFLRVSPDSPSLAPRLSYKSTDWYHVSIFVLSSFESPQVPTAFFFPLPCFRSHVSLCSFPPLSAPLLLCPDLYSNPPRAIFKASISRFLSSVDSRALYRAALSFVSSSTHTGGFFLSCRPGPVLPPRMYEPRRIFESTLGKSRPIRY